MVTDELDFRLLFEESPDVLLVLLPDRPRFTMVAATRSRYLATNTTPEQTIGVGLFELFPDNPDDPRADGMRNLRASLERVLQQKKPDTMAVQKYDIRMPDGAFVVRYWSPRNIPVLAADGAVRYILHRVEDVTELVRAGEVGDELRDRNRAMEREVIARSHELATANSELRLANVKLGELDAAKTAFFSNISHEFRTPLTLMLGPLEDSLAARGDPLSPAHRERLQLAHDNTLRLHKLVNALLDFSRLEAGRLRAHYAPLDVAAFTAQLAGMFRSAMQQAGLRLKLECPPLSRPVWVDREMWEKIVANLVSNAFKFTLKGEIVVRVREEPEQVVLEVTDTGVGIPERELPRIFERFHRVEGTAGRTQEGSGIGLSLVRELIDLHGGDITVASAVDRGTTFRITLPRGTGHLPAKAVSETPVTVELVSTAAAHAAEAARWTPRPAAPAPSLAAEAVADDATPDRAARPRVLLADDNADLRQYISALLRPHFDVVAVVDGRAALDEARRQLPDIVVSDVMMPGMDGFALVHALRGDPATAAVPVILLSARAGEEAAIEGLDAGSDDYLVKPFSARELLTRVRSHIELARARQALIAELRRTNRELDAFSYAVSHDLRAPLRSIEGFSQALKEDCAALLTEQGHDYLDRICAAVSRMAALIDALLELSRISRADLVNTEVDLSALAGDVVADLRRAEPARAVTVTIAPGLRAAGDRRLLSVVLVNLIGNAWKFTARKDEARVEVGQQPGVDEPTFFVRDNGAGFDMAYAGRLFTAFQRLHTPQDFPGTGIGLATVQRVVARHGGWIWAESTPGQGATFFVRLPRQPPLNQRTAAEATALERR